MKKVGIVGAGAIARWHADRWRQLPVKLAGFYDIVPETAVTAQEAFGGKVYDKLDDLLADVDVVDICTKTSAHKEGVLAAAAAGKAIVCEKPLARHLVDCEEMVDACEAAGVPLFVAQVVRFFPQFAKAKALIDEGRIGQPGVIRTVRGGSPPYAGTRPWFADFDESGGVMMDVGVHDIDFQRWCMGEVERVFARGLAFHEDKEELNGRDHALISLRFTSGAVGHIEASWCHPQGVFRTRLEIAGDGGLIEWDSLTDQPYRTSVGEDDSVTRSNTSPLAPEDDPYYQELAHFLDCLENDKPCIVTPQDGLMAVKVALAALASIRRNKPVLIAEFEETLP